MLKNLKSQQCLSCLMCIADSKMLRGWLSRCACVQYQVYTFELSSLENWIMNHCTCRQRVWKESNWPNMILSLLVVVFAVVVIVQLIRLAFSDCDLTLQFADKFGRKVGKYGKLFTWYTDHPNKCLKQWLFFKKKTKNLKTITRKKCAAMALQ